MLYILPVNDTIYMVIDMKYLTSGEIAVKWNISERSVRNYCNNGRVEGAILQGKTWLIPENAEKALEIIMGGEAKETDYLEVGGKRCMNVGGIGMDVDVLERCNRGKLKGKIKYLMSLLQSLFAFKGLPILIESEGREEKHDALIAAVCNGTQFGGGIVICPTAVADDQLIDVVIVDCIGGKWKIVKAFIELMKGRVLQYPLTTHFRCERVRFATDTPCTAQLDGELYTELDFDVKLCRGLRFYR